MLTKVEHGPIPQHGTPVDTSQPFDRATVDKLAGGRNLSDEAFKTLKQHVSDTSDHALFQDSKGDIHSVPASELDKERAMDKNLTVLSRTPAGTDIEAGSTPKNLLHKLSEPVQKTLTDTGLKMNQVVQKAPAFKTSTIADPTTNLLKDIDDVRDNLPLKLNDPLNRVVDTQMEAAYPVLESTDPSEVLAYRRKLGSQIDWANITHSPETAGEAKNLAQAKIYNALGTKLHAEIPETVDLDKVFQPNLELQTFLDKNGVSRNPVDANAEHLSELAKGKRKVAVDAHNAQVDKNWNRIKMAGKVVGYGGLGYEAAKHVIE
jgi:hypothetical protein